MRTKKYYTILKWVVFRFGASDREGDLRYHQRDQPAGRDHPADRAECQHGAADCGYRLCAGDWAHYREGKRSADESEGAGGISGEVEYRLKSVRVISQRALYGGKEPDMDFRIRKADEQDLPGIMHIMEEAKHNPQHPDWFMADDQDYVRDHLQEKGFVLVAVAPEGKIAGFFMVKYPEREKHLGEFLGDTEEQMRHTAVMDSAAVDSAYQGNGLQRKMAFAAEALIDRSQYQYLLCTIHPDNKYSLSNMRSQGYEVRADVECYGGRRRYVLEKCL